MKVLDTGLADVKLIELQVFHDERGYFLESFRAQRYQSLLGLDAPLVQDNRSCSFQGVLRGLHFQSRHSQGKLVQVAKGEIYDVAVDMRRNSPTFGRWQGLVLAASAFQQLWIPPGFAHGFVVTSREAVVEYKCTDYYHPEYEVCLLWNDPTLSINWPVKEPLLSAKDQQGLLFQDIV